MKGSGVRSSHKWLAAALLATSQLWAAEPWEASRSFWLDMNWPDTRGSLEKTDNITAEVNGAAVPGKRLTPETWAVEETVKGRALAAASGGFVISSVKNLPTGATDQAVEWPAAAMVDPGQGALSLFVQGEKWDVATPQRETLLVLEGKAGSLSLEKNKPGTLAVVVSGTAVIETPLVAPEHYHHLVVNFETDTQSKAGKVT